MVQRYLEGTCGFTILQENIKLTAGIFEGGLLLTKNMVLPVFAQRTYTGDFKIYVVEYMHNNGISIRQSAAHFNIPSPSTIVKWERIYMNKVWLLCMKNTGEGRPKWGLKREYTKRRYRKK